MRRRPATPSVYTYATAGGRRVTHERIIAAAGPGCIWVTARVRRNAAVEWVGNDTPPGATVGDPRSVVHAGGGGVSMANIAREMAVEAQRAGASLEFACVEAHADVSPQGDAVARVMLRPLGVEAMPVGIAHSAAVVCSERLRERLPSQHVVMGYAVTVEWSAEVMR